MNSKQALALLDKSVSEIKMSRENHALHMNAIKVIQRDLDILDELKEKKVDSDLLKQIEGNNEKDG